MTSDGRPDPQTLLKAIQKMDDKKGRGRMRIFLGMCPGVGKTFAMLEAAQEQQRRGVKVLVGVVETHKRKETEELLTGLTVLPRSEIQYKGSQLFEMDLDRILKEPPDLVLVDELAHSNAPGSRHQKRFQDVQEILAAGIDVYTTINIQHIESRNDQVAQITNVSVKETVPDSFLEIADQVEVIDLSPSELLYRLNEGKVYLGDQAKAAAQNFFQEERLTALRELALRFTAEKVDQDLHDQMTLKGIEGPWNTNERILVAVSYSPYSSRLIRAARRMAYNLGAPWIALYVDTGDPLSGDDQETLQKNLALARELGAEIITSLESDINHAIQKVCRDRNVTQIIMGRPDKRFFRDLLARGTLLDRLVSTTSKIDVHVIRAERQPRYRGFRLRWPYIKTGLVPYSNTAMFLLAVSVLCYLALPYVGYKAIGPVFLLSILAVASLTDRGPILFAAVISALVWDYFFIPPQYTFVITTSDDVLMVLSFFVTALVGGFLTTRIRKQQEILEIRGERTRALYELGKSLSEAKTAREIVAVLRAKIEKQFQGRAVVLLTGQNGKFNLADTVQIPEAVGEKEFAVANWAFENGKISGWSTQTLSGASCLCIPMKGNSGIVGILALFPGVKQRELTLDQQSFLDSVINHVSLALERLRYSEAAEAAKLYKVSESLHQTLLDSISHEMRTPLTVIMGTATALADRHTPRDQMYVQASAEQLVVASDRLNRVIENLLDMSRLNSGVLALQVEKCEIHDLVSAAIHKLGQNLAHHDLQLAFPPQLPRISADFRLMEHALSNLLLNAATYSPPNTRILISAKTTGAGKMTISVEDEGPGIPSGIRDKVFEKFYRVPGTPAGGVGLGLSIVKSIVDAHRGRVFVEEVVPQGSRFVMELPT